MRNTVLYLLAEKEKRGNVLIRLENVSFRYGDLKAVENVSLQIEREEFIGLIGPNSSGKSSLLRLLAGTQQPGQGKIFLEGRPLDEWPLRELARTVAVVSAENYFVFPFTAQQIVLMGRTPYRRWGWTENAADLAAVHRAMERTDVWGLRERPVDELSSGERQRVLLARALAQEPRILLLDEPTAHLDLGHEWSLFELLRELHREKHLTIVCALHDLSWAARFCTRLLLMHQGHLFAAGPPRDVLDEQTLQAVFGIRTQVVWAKPPSTSLIIQPIERTFP